MRSLACWGGALTIALGLFATTALSGCNSGTLSAKGIVGTYQVQISAMGKSDPDYLALSQGKSGTLLLNFTVGITTDPMGPNAGGLRASTGPNGSIKIAAQPAHIDHSTGQIDGSLAGSGMIAPDGSMLMLNLQLTPTNFAVPQGDGGAIPDGGSTTTLDYTVTGMKTM